MQHSWMQNALDSRTRVRLLADLVQVELQGLPALGRQFNKASCLLAVMLYLAVGQAVAGEAQVPIPLPAPEPEAPLTAAEPAPMAPEAAGPKLEMRPASADAAGKHKRPGGKRDEDARACLEQATIAKIRACAEKFR